LLFVHRGYTELRFLVTTIVIHQYLETLSIHFEPRKGNYRTKAAVLYILQCHITAVCARNSTGDRQSKSCAMDWFLV
jgi:hypothetical protein